ncbi:MAG: hypothetical protein Q9223_005810 [Gallowayella weberi]
MVVVLELDGDDAFDPYARPKGLDHSSVTIRPKEAQTQPSQRPNPNINNFSKSLGCYPIVTQLTQYIDLNTLHALSRTCRQFRANLLQYRTRLVQQTLHCGNESTPGPFDDHYSRRSVLVSGRVSPCARDMVSDCRRCGRIVCRNCAHKPPSASLLRQRHRRLCSKCLATPLPQLSRHWQDPCTCDSSVYLCAPCGTGLNVADTNYLRIWTWRTRYSTYLGGLGTGVGEGNEGVKCWRGEKCVAAQEVEVEIDCSEEGRTSDRESSESSDSERQHWPEGEGKEERAGYWQQEIEGIGGVVKKKIRKRVKMGKTVKEWEDERDGKDEVLGREARGEGRSWCGWCGRVVWGEKDQKAFGGAPELQKRL